jgi:putative methyltransferase (TIGR04325 family)
MSQLTRTLLNSPLRSIVYGRTRFGYATKFIGVFSSWAEALAAIPSGNPVGYNEEEATKIYLSYPTTLVRPGDYPMLLHIRNIAEPGMRVIDIGGCIGMTYYTALKYYPLPSTMSWAIYDVPAVLDAGRQVAIREGGKSASLSFLDSLKDAGECDLVCSTGSLQLIEESLPELLSQLPRLPKHILLNRIPVRDGHSLVTLNEQGFSICPYKVFSRKEFVQSIEELGYKLIDDWSCPERPMSIRFHPRYRLKAYSGFYFSQA